MTRSQVILEYSNPISDYRISGFSLRTKSVKLSQKGIST